MTTLLRTAPDEEWIELLSDGHSYATFDLRAKRHLSSSAPADGFSTSELALIAELESKSQETRSRNPLKLPRVPSRLDYQFFLQSEKKTQSSDPDKRAEEELLKMHRDWQATRQAKRSTGSNKELWKVLAERDGWTRCWVFFCDLSYRLLNDRHLKGLAQPTEAELARAIEGYFWKHLGYFLQYPEADKARLHGYADFAFVQPDRVPAHAELAARAIVTDWTPQFIEQRQKDGSTSRSRGRTGTGLFDKPEAVDELLGMVLDGMTRVEMAARFGVDPVTVRRALKRIEEKSKADIEGM